MKLRNIFESYDQYEMEQRIHNLAIRLNRGGIPPEVLEELQPLLDEVTPDEDPSIVISIIDEIEAKLDAL